MIFRRSLSKKKGAAYSFFSGLSAGFVPAVLIALLQTFLMAAIPLINFINTDFGSSDAVGERQLSKDLYKFFIYDFSDPAEFYVLFAVLGILSIIVAIKLFSFICDKKTVNVFYSLGIKRSTLFMSKYMAGALLLICATLIPVILSYIVNLIFLGGSWQLSLVMLHMYCGLSVFSLICFSVASVVFSSVGTVSEAVVYSASLLFAPTIIIFLTEQIIGAFLSSSTVNLTIFEFGLSDHDNWGSAAPSLLETTSDYNPLLFFVNEICAFAKGFITDGKLTLRIDHEVADWYIPKLFIHLPWFIAASGLGILGSLLFKRIKAENCGFLNTNKLLSNLTIFELCLLGSAVLLGEIEWTEMWVVAIAGFGAAFGLYLIAEIFLKRNFLKILKSLYKFVIHMTVVCLIYGICMTGVFGYSDHIPDKSKISSAEISLPVSYSSISMDMMHYNWNTNDFINAFEPYVYSLLPEMNDPADIDKIMEFNRKIIDIEKNDGIANEIIIRYNLKNGKVSERRHTITSKDELSELLKLTELKGYKDEIRNVIYSPFTMEELKAEYEQYGYIDEANAYKLAFTYKYSEVIARSTSLQENRVLNLTEEQFNTLKDAVYKDISALSYEDYYFGNKPQTGILSFGIKDEVFGEIRNEQNIHIMHNTEEVSSPAVFSEPAVTPEEEFTGTEDYPEDELFSEDELFPEEPADTRYLYTDTMQYQGLGGMRDQDRSYDIIITEDMTNTLNALAGFGLSDCFMSELAIESVAFREYDLNEIFSYYRYNTRNYIFDFFAYPVFREDLYYISDDISLIEDSIAENKITDKEKINTLVPLMKLHEYTFNDGFFCIIKYSNGTYNVKYLSREDAPDFVKNFSYTLNNNPVY